MKIHEIQTELFAQVTICDFGVRFVSFDAVKWRSNGSCEEVKDLYTITVNLLKDGRLMIITSVNNTLSFDQIEEIQRVSKILRS